MVDDPEIADLVRRLRATNGRGYAGKLKIEAAAMIERLCAEAAVFRTTRRLFHRLHVINAQNHDRNP